MLSFKMFHWLTFFLIVCQDVFLIALPVVFGRTWTSHAGAWRLWYFRSKIKNKMILRPLVLSVFDFFNKSAFFLLFWSVYILPGTIHSYTRQFTLNMALFLVKVKTGDFGTWMKTRFFRKFSLKAHYYPAYYTWKGDDWPNWTVLSNSGISSM